MRRFAIATAAIMFGTAVMAQSSTTTIKREEGPLGDRTTTIKKEDEDGTVTKRKVESTGAIGCQTKSTTKTNDDGDSKTKTVTNC